MLAPDLLKPPKIFDQVQSQASQSYTVKSSNRPVPPKNTRKQNTIRIGATSQQQPQPPKDHDNDSVHSNASGKSKGKKAKETTLARPKISHSPNQSQEDDVQSVHSNGSKHSHKSLKKENTIMQKPKLQGGPRPKPQSSHANTNAQKSTSFKQAWKDQEQSVIKAYTPLNKISPQPAGGEYLARNDKAKKQEKPAKFMPFAEIEQQNYSDDEPVIQLIEPASYTNKNAVVLGTKKVEEKQSLPAQSRLLFDESNVVFGESKMKETKSRRRNIFQKTNQYQNSSKVSNSIAQSSVSGLGDDTSRRKSKTRLRELFNSSRQKEQKQIQQSRNIMESESNMLSIGPLPFQSKEFVSTYHKPSPEKNNKFFPLEKKVLAADNDQFDLGESRSDLNLSSSNHLGRVDGKDRDSLIFQFEPEKKKGMSLVSAKAGAKPQQNMLNLKNNPLKSVRTNEKMGGQKEMINVNNTLVSKELQDVHKILSANQQYLSKIQNVPLADSYQPFADIKYNDAFTNNKNPPSGNQKGIDTQRPWHQIVNDYQQQQVINIKTVERNQKKINKISDKDLQVQRERQKSMQKEREREKQKEKEKERQRERQRIRQQQQKERGREREKQLQMLRRRQREQKQLQNLRRKQREQKQKQIQMNKKRMKQQNQRIITEKRRQDQRKQRQRLELQKKQKQQQQQRDLLYKRQIQRQELRRAEKYKKEKLQREKQEIKTQQNVRQNKFKELAQQPEQSYAPKLNNIQSSFSKDQSQNKSETSNNSNKKSKQKKETTLARTKNHKVYIRNQSPRAEQSFYEPSVDPNQQSILQKSKQQNLQKQEKKPKLLSFSDEEQQKKPKSKTDMNFYDYSQSQKSIKPPSSKPPLSRRTNGSGGSLSKQKKPKQKTIAINVKEQTMNKTKHVISKPEKKMTLMQRAMMKHNQESSNGSCSQDSFRNRQSVESQVSKKSNSSRGSKKESTLNIKIKDNSMIHSKHRNVLKKQTSSNSNSHEQQLEQIQRLRQSQQSRERSRQRQRALQTQKMKQNIVNHRVVVSKNCTFIDEKGRLVSKDLVIKGKDVYGIPSVHQNIDNIVIQRMKRSRDSRKSRSKSRDKNKLQKKSSQEGSESQSYNDNSSYGSSSFYQNNSRGPSRQNSGTVYTNYGNYPGSTNTLKEFIRPIEQVPIYQRAGYKAEQQFNEEQPKTLNDMFSRKNPVAASNNNSMNQSRSRKSLGRTQKTFTKK